MKKAGLLFVVMLAAAAPAGARRQEQPTAGALRFRVGDALRGPVRAVRTEQADFKRVGGESVEGPRRLVSARSYSPDGKRAEHESYRPDGSLARRSVYLYADDGQLAEESHYDGGGALVGKKSYARPPGETLTFGADGALLNRVVTVRNAAGVITEILTYDGGGALLSRSVNTREQGGRKSVWTIHGPDGKVTGRTEHDLKAGEPHRTESLSYDGKGPARRVATGDARASRIEAVEENADGTLRGKTVKEHEYDARGNLIKQTFSRWDEAAGRFVPLGATYNTITYY